MIILISLQCTLGHYCVKSTNKFTAGHILDEALNHISLDI